MASSKDRTLRVGVYAATMTFFQPDTHKLDLKTLEDHILRLADAGLTGIVALGSNGEAPHLSRDERKATIRCIVDTLNSAGHTDMPVIAGASGQSTLETLELSRDVKNAGGSHVLVLPPSYFVAAMSDDAIYDYYMEVAAGSPLPVILYSFPAVTSGITMSSDLLIRISNGHGNIVGTKFTCGDTGKLARVARAMKARTPSQPEGSYWAVGGLADFTLQALVSGASGVIAGGANVLPKTTVRVFELYKQGKIEEAVQVQSLLADGDGTHTAAGIPGTKAVLQHAFGYGGPPRSPLRQLTTQQVNEVVSRMHEALSFEKSL